MDCSARTPLIALLVASVLLVAGSGCSTAKPKLSRDAASADSSQTSAARTDAGQPSRDARVIDGIDASTLDAGLDASGYDAGPNVQADAADPAFAILGITGPNDNRVDEWLMGTPAPTIHFTRIVQLVPADGSRTRRRIWSDHLPS